MSTSYLLDSSVLVQFLKKDTIVLQRFVEAEAVYISTIALGELYYGAEHSDDVQKSLDKVNASV